MQQEMIEQSLEEFDTLTLNNTFEVFLIQGTENKIKVEGASKIIKDVSFIIQNNNLIIDNSYKHKWLHPENNKMKVYITLNGLRRIVANETCNIQTLNTLNANILSLEVYGKLNNAKLEMNCDYFLYNNAFPSGGMITLSGNTNELRIINDALMTVDAEKLNAKSVYIENYSKGECKVTSSQSITYKIAGEGDIILNGHPQTIVNKGQNASGSLVVQ